MRRICLVFAVVVFTCGFAFAQPNVPSGATARPNLPKIAESAFAYRTSIEAIKTDRNAAQLLRTIKAAEAAKKTAELIQLYEELVSLNKENFRAWLQLGLTWRAAEPFAEKGLSAAYLAHLTARSPADQLEALLLMSSLLRTRLEQHKDQYEAARREMLKAEGYLAYLQSAERAGEIAGLDPDSPTGNSRLLTQTRDNARQNAELALRQITQTIADLDEVYREIASKVPNAQPEAMKEGDARSAVFTVVTAAGPSDAEDQEASQSGRPPRLNFPIEGVKVNVCLEFTQELRIDNQTYKGFVEVKRGESTVPGFAVETKDRTLCLSGLEPGSEYEIKLLQGLPSRLGGKLANTVVVPRVRLPNLPKQVGFSGRSFILPASGPGEIALNVTNLDSFDLQLFRITDRTLHRQIALGYVGSALPYMEYTELRDHFAELLWTGSIQLLHPKDNVPIRTLLQVRSLLKDRNEWLRREIGTANKDQREFVSARVPVPATSAERLGGTGQYFAGVPSFEAAALDLKFPGVYALLARDMADDKKKKRSDCEGDCDNYLVQWFVDTDIGLTFYEGDEKFTVVARSLQSGAAKPKAKIELVSAGNRILAARETDGNGVVTFPRSLTRGTQSNQLTAILAYQGDDFSFMSFGPERLDLSRLNLDGRPRVNKFDGFLTTDRGIYQPGETVRLLALIRDAQRMVPDAVPPATIRLEARDRVVVEHRVKPPDWSLGGAVVPIEIPKNMRPGTARITLSMGDEASIAEAIIQIGPVRPDRARLQFLDQKSWQVRRTTNGISITGSASAQYLFGAKGLRQGAAAELKAEILVKVAAAESPAGDCYDKFSFGRFDDTAIAVSSRHFVEYTDRQGNLNLQLSGIEIPNSTKPLAATVEITLFDASGPLASRSAVFPIADERGWIGISKIPFLPPGNRQGTFDLGVDIVAITSDNKPAADGSLDFRIERERDQYVWERRDDAWQHIRSVQREPLASGSIPAARLRGGRADSRGCVAALRIEDIAQGLEVGRYVLTMRDPQSNRETAVRFQTGVASTSPDQLEPNIFTLSTNKSSFQSGEAIEITAEVPFDGERLIAFADEDILWWESGQVRNGTGRISLRVPREWEGKGLYALATAFRSGAGGTTSAGPARAIGATYFEVKGSQTGYAIAIEKLGNAAQGYVGPNESLSFKACILDSAGTCSKTPPASAYAAAFVVDEGLLSLTGHHDPVPDPERHFFGRKRFALRVMDNYNRLLLKPGGDRPSRLALSNYTSPRILSLVQGPLRLENGSAVFNFNKIDLQSGAASIFVVVWSKDYATANSSNVRIRSQVVADIDVPPFLYAGDRAILPLRLENIDFDPAYTEFKINVAASVPASGVALFAGAVPPPQPRPNAEFRISLPQGGPKTVYVAVDTPPNGRGTVSLDLSMEALGSPVPLVGHRYSWTLELRAPTLASVDTLSFPLQRQPTNLNSLAQGLIAEAYDPESVTVTARLSDNMQSLLTAAFDLKKETGPPLLEHLVWRGLALLHSAGRESAPDRQQELRRILGQIQSLQSPDGSFVPYRTVGNFTSAKLNLMGSLLTTVSVLDFLSLANSFGYEVPDQSLRAARQIVETSLPKLRGDNPECGLPWSYAWLVLIRLKPVDYEKIRYLETCVFEGPPTEAVAAALAAKYGLAEQAKLILADFQSEPEQLKELSDLELAMTLAFLTEAGAPAQLLNQITESLFSRDRKISLSMAAVAWALRAAAERGGPPASRLTLADVQVEGAAAGLLQLGQYGVIESAPIPYQRLRSAPVSIALRRDIQARGFLTIEGNITKPSAIKRVPAGTLKRRMFNLDTGDEIAAGQGQWRIGDRLVVVIEGDHRALAAAVGADRAGATDQDTGPLLIADLLPSSFQLVSNNVFGQKDFQLQGALRELKPLGDLRSVETGGDRWVGLVIPESWRVREQPPGEPNTPPPAPPTVDVEFRQGYVVQLNMAGRFTYPALAIESTTVPVQTLRAEQSNIEVGLPELPGR
jgi:uncharacterized protein YfaS (alpha-2-macroglobulin family)